MGTCSQALQAFHEELAINQRLATAKPKDALAQADLGVSQERLGNVHMELAQYAKAIGFFQEALLIYQSLHHASLAHGLRTELVRLSQSPRPGPAGARRRSPSGDGYGQALTIIQRMAEADPRNAQMQRDLSIVLEMLGANSVQQRQPAIGLKLFERSLAIRQRRATADPHDSEAPRSGQALRMDRRLPGAVGRFSQSPAKLSTGSMTILQQLTKDDPEDMLTQRALIVSLSHWSRRPKAGSIRRSREISSGAMEAVDACCFADFKSISAR